MESTAFLKSIARNSPAIFYCVPALLKAGLLAQNLYHQLEHMLLAVCL